jgi:hypothetical protein
MTCFQKHLRGWLQQLKIPHQKGELGIFSRDGCLSLTGLKTVLLKAATARLPIGFDSP